MRQSRSCIVLLVAIALSWLAAPDAGAAVVTLDFEDVTAPVGDATAYLSSFGITLANAYPAGQAGVVSIYNFSGPLSDWADNNFLYQNGTGAPPCAYTMIFSAPLLNVQFTRVATPPSLSWIPEWSATAYVGAQAVGSVGFPSLQYVGGGSAAQTFSLSGNGITSLTIYSFGQYFTGIGAVPLDDFVLTSESPAVPEPTTLLVWSGMGAVGLVAARRARRRAA